MPDDPRFIEDREGGFTLIELLVVMIIIGILAAIAIPSFLRQRQNAISTSQVADLRSVADEVEGFNVANEVYPADTEFAYASGQVTITTPGGTGMQRVTVGNSVSYHLDPGTGTAYCITASNRKAAQDRFWVSNAGGVQPTSVSACPF